MRVIALIQARMASRRLPGKVMKKLHGKPMLLRVVERVRQIPRVHETVVVTSYEPQDQVIQHYCERNGIAVFTGSECDVLERYYRAAQAYHAQAVLRITADCPFVDPRITGRLVRAFLASNWDHAGIQTGVGAAHVIGPKYPDGLDSEIMRFSCLETAWREAQDNRDREHVTPFIWRQPQRFSIGTLAPAQDYAYLHLSVDTMQDYRLAKLIYQKLCHQNNTFLLDDVVAFLNVHAGLLKINQPLSVNIEREHLGHTIG